MGDEASTGRPGRLYRHPRIGRGPCAGPEVRFPLAAISITGSRGPIPDPALLISRNEAPGPSSSHGQNGCISLENYAPFDYTEKPIETHPMNQGHLNQGHWKVTAGFARFIFLAVFVAHSTVAAQKTIEVPLHYKTVQAAIDAANELDIVLVSPGIYDENINFKGKTIVVRSRYGSWTATLNGKFKGSVVTFQGGEKKGTVLEGFTIVNGTGRVEGFFTLGGGVFCRNASPQLSDLVFRDNVVSGIFAYGGGAYLSGGSPVVTRCTFTSNIASSWGGGLCTDNSSAYILSSTFADNFADLGGGLMCSGGGVKVLNSVFLRNKARAGGGVYCNLDVKNEKIFTNNTLIENAAVSSGGGFCSASDRSILTNNILWSNHAVKGPELHVGRDCGICIPSDVTISHSLVKGGLASTSAEEGATLAWGSGMIDGDPLLVDFKNFDMHIAYGSPCRNTGSNSAPGLPAIDFEWDQRIHDTTVDIGADEFAPHLYSVGEAILGRSVVLKVSGKPGSAVILGHSQAVLDPPITIPGVGTLLLDLITLTIKPLGLIPAGGIYDYRLALDPMIPAGSWPFQALIGSQLSNLNILTIVKVIPTNHG